MLEQFFNREFAEDAYHSGAEAIGDIRAFVDLCLNLAFYGRDPVQERLDMRGVVITPQEFELALGDWTLEARNPGEARREKRDMIREELTLALLHIDGRVKRSQMSGNLPEVHRAVRELKLSGLERLCFWLALVLEYDRKYERLYGYLQDNAAAKQPTLGLGISLYQLMEPQAEEASLPWIPADSPIWQTLLRDLPGGEGESLLSRPLSLRLEVLSCLRDEMGGAGKDGNKSRRITKEAQIPGAVLVRLGYRWEDLIAEDEQTKLLHLICDRIHYRDVVMEEWGFGKKSPYGNGVSAVFYGAPGTGKTMAAQIIGRELDREVWKVDLSQMVSKYIGETEKNLKALFDAAGRQNCILFFDEADSLFAKRSEVSTSNDRYANMETGYLLQQFEEFEGVSILATNYIGNLDEAFRRRIKFYVRFPFPDPDMRRRLWVSMIPEQARRDEEIPFDMLAAKFELPGSDIKEVITGAAYLAAAGGHGIRCQDIEEALRIHYLKLGRKMSSRELKII